MYMHAPEPDFYKAFKDADIRGVYPTELNDEVAYLVARAFVQLFNHKKVVVGRDMRLSSPALHKSFVTGVTDAGADVVDIGLVPTPALYHASGALNLPGVMITASHSPKAHNGLKLVLAGAIPLTNTTGLKAIRSLVQQPKLIEPKKRGNVTSKNTLAAFAKYVYKIAPLSKNIPPISIVADAGNAMGAVTLEAFDALLPIKTKVLLPTLDGNFPHRGSNPTLKKNQKIIKDALTSAAYDFGISYDGDADRVVFFDEKGNYINSAVIGALVATALLDTHPKAKLIYTVLTSRIYEETIREKGGTPVHARVGHAFIKETMRKRDVVFGCEHSAHFYYKDFFYTDSVMLTLLYVLRLYATHKQAGGTFSSLVKPYQKYHQTEDLMIYVDNKNAALETIAKHKQLRAFTITHKDGLILESESAWGVIKPSVTEAALNVIVESTSKKRAEECKKMLVELIITAGGTLKAF
jgi:phosphomannomutase